MLLNVSVFSFMLVSNQLKMIETTASKTQPEAEIEPRSQPLAAQNANTELTSPLVTVNRGRNRIFE